MTRTAIFIRSYAKDYDWLSYCLRSIQRFAKGFRWIVVCVPKGQEGPLMKLTAEKIVTTEDGQPGYLCQQSNKLHADLNIPPGVDYVLHMDSDMIFTGDVNPDFFFHEGKPVWVITPWSAMGTTEKRAWFHVMAKALQECPPYEFMRKCAMLIPVWLYAEFRAHIQTLHGRTLEQYVMNQPCNEFSEYNCIGFYAWLYHRDKFHWHDTSIDGIPKWPFVQRWSWGGLTPEIRNEMEISLA